MIVFRCPNCGKRMKVPASSAGTKGKCSRCKTVFTAPAESEIIADPGATLRPVKIKRSRKTKSKSVAKSVAKPVAKPEAKPKATVVATASWSLELPPPNPPQFFEPPPPPRPSPGRLRRSHLIIVGAVFAVIALAVVGLMIWSSPGQSASQGTAADVPHANAPIAKPPPQDIVAPPAPAPAQAAAYTPPLKGSVPAEAMLAQIRQLVAAGLDVDANHLPRVAARVYAVFGDREAAIAAQEAFRNNDPSTTLATQCNLACKADAQAADRVALLLITLKGRFRHGDFEGAVKIADEILAIVQKIPGVEQPENASLLGAAAEAMLFTNRVDPALAILKRYQPPPGLTVADDPLKSVVERQIKLGRFDFAERLITVAENPARRIELQLQIAAALLRKGDRPAARKFLQAADGLLKQLPAPPDPRLAAAVESGLADAIEAVPVVTPTDYKAALKSAPENDFTANGPFGRAARQAVLAGDTDAVVARLKGINADLLEDLLSACERTRNYDGVREILDRSLEVELANPRDYHALSIIINKLWDMGDQAKALAAAGKAAQLSASEGSASEGRVEILATLVRLQVYNNDFAAALQIAAIQPNVEAKKSLLVAAHEALFEKAAPTKRRGPR